MKTDVTFRHLNLIGIHNLLGIDNNVTTNSMSFALTQDMKYLEQCNPISAIRRYE